MDTLPFRVASALELGQLAPDALRHLLAGPPGPALPGSARPPWAASSMRR